ncbi:MAG: hypothetical protein JO086_09385, partial [Acidimicrobiia bacterium]|nr:hypothetical protein [Acidimicrobiia bacterium]
DMTDGAGTSHWDWDSLHRMTTSRIGTSGAVTTYSYDLANRPTVTTYPGSKAVTRGYDAAGRPATVADWLSHTTTYSPDADGNLHTADTPLSGATQRDTWNYNPADQLTSTQFGTTTNAAALGSLTYGPDANGMLATQNDTTPGTLNHSYLYDNANRLASADSSPYAYDQAGDATQLGTGPRQAFDNANQACFQSATSAPGTCAAPPAAATTFGYDTRGNRTTQSIAGIGGTNYSYDQANRLTQAAPAAPSGNQGQYNALTGARILDTGATPPTGSCPGTTCANIPAGGTLKVQVTGQGGVPASGVGAVNLAVSVLNASSAGLVTLWPSDAPQPGTSNVNYPLNTWTSNMAIVKVAADGTISIYNNGGSVRVLLDVSGWYATSSGQPGSGFNALTGSRILDTRVPTGTCVPGPCGRIAANSILKLQVGGQGGVPTTAKAVAINVTATGQAGGTNLIVWPDGQAMPGVTSVVVPTTGNKSQLVEVPLPAGGSGVVDIYSWLAATDVVVDVVGWYGSTATSLYQPLAGSRSMDTRSAPLSVCPDGCQKLVAGGTLVLHVTGRNGVPAQGVSAVAVNITTTNASSGGYLTAWPSDQARPATSLSFPPSQDTGNAAIVKVAGDGTISIYNAQGSVDLVVDVEGYYLQPAPTSTYTYNGDGLRTSKTVSGTVTNFTWDESGALAQLSGDGTYTYVYGPDGTPLEQVSGTTVTWLHHDR